MNKAEEYIKEHTRQCSNTFWDKNDGEYNCSWLTPDQARKAVEIAREQMIEWLEENAFKYMEKQNTMFGTIKVFNSHKLANDLKQAMK